jgi:hypothetical protein
MVCFDAPPQADAIVIRYELDQVMKFFLGVREHPRLGAAGTAQPLAT